MMVSMLYKKYTFSNRALTHFVLENQYLKILKKLRKELIILIFSMKILGVCNVIQEGILLWKDEFETIK